MLLNQFLNWILKQFQISDINFIIICLILATRRNFISILVSLINISVASYIKCVIRHVACFYVLGLLGQLLELLLNTFFIWIFHLLRIHFLLFLDGVIELGGFLFQSLAISKDHISQFKCLLLLKRLLFLLLFFNSWWSITKGIRHITSFHILIELKSHLQPYEIYNEENKKY